MPGGGLEDVVAGGAAAGGKGLGVGLAALAFYRLVAFLLNFIAARLDARQAAIDRQQAWLDASYARRLEHLERTERANRTEIGRLRECVEMLAAELRAKDPQNPKLLEISRALAVAYVAPPPSDTPDDMTDLLGRAK
jgi:hypothetical protein